MTRVRVFTFPIVGLALLLFCLATPAQKRKSRTAKRSPTITEIDTAGLKSLLARQSQHPLLVNFWATWCDPCRDEFPDLVKIDNEYRSQGLEFVAVSLDDLKDINTEVPKFLQQMQARMPTYLLNAPDPELAISAVDPQWGGALPATFLYDANRNVVYKHFGRITSEELRAAIQKQVGGKQ
jgi:thiol-disulfide isomerase/thioredoxin